MNLFGPILDLFWTYFGPILDLFLSYLGHFRGYCINLLYFNDQKYFKILENIFGPIWTYFGPIWELFSPF